MIENTITPELLVMVDEAIIKAEYPDSDYVIFNGPSYRFKVVNEVNRLIKFRKELNKARKAARAKPWSPQSVAGQVRYHNSARGQREAQVRLSANDYDNYLTA